MRKRPLEAIVLLGPTGAGKTPLGALLEARGLGGRRCAHFDFGENLRRAVAAGPAGASLTGRDRAFLRDVLATGALLEDKDFPIAARILRSFLGRYDPATNTLTVLNGLPRHVGQAVALAAIIHVRAVVVLHCPPATVAARIAANTGGDRGSRTDDDPAAIRHKVAVFMARTVPLVDYYRDAGATLAEIDVAADMRAAQMARAIERQLPAGW